MSDGKRQPNPGALIGMGICFIGVGIAIGAALRDSMLGAGSGLTGLGVIFLIMGIARKRKLESDESRNHDGDRPPA